MHAPLSDVRILAVEQYGAGPYGTSHLAALGAEVTKVEDVAAGGDVGRYVPPYQEGTSSLFFETLNRGKRSIGLDLRRAEGREVFERLVARNDVVYSNLRGDVPAKLGLRYADLAHLNPAVVCCSLSAFGMTGPRHDEPGYDYIVQGLAGWMSITGEPDAPPTKTGLSLVDWAAGLVAAGTVLAGLHAARRDGVGMDCDVSMHDVALNLQGYLATWVLSAGYEPQRTRHSAHPSLVPFQNLQTADGWVVVACAKEKFWRRLTGELGRPDLLEDPRFADFASRSAHAAELLAVLEPQFAADTTATWVTRMQAAGVPCGPVNDVAQALRDAQVTGRGLVLETEHPVLGTVRQLASPFQVGDWTEPARRAPLLDEDRAEILAELGLTPAEIGDLAAGGAFGSAGDAVRR